MRSPVISLRSIRFLALGLIVLPVLAACSKDKPLEGERIHLRQTDSAAVATGQTLPLPPAVQNADWTQTNGSASHNLGHVAGPAGLTRAWSVDAGQGDTGKSAITSPPIVVNGTIYTLDAAAQLSAFSASTGAPSWRVSLVPEGEKAKDGFGGGLAEDGGTIYAATGFGEILAISPAAGEILWRQSFGAPFRAAPAASGGLVVAVTRDNLAVALEAATGALRWRLQAASVQTGFLGGASPAMEGRLVVLPFASGELVAVDGKVGRRLWSAVLSGGRKGLARSAITDVSGDPVIVGPYIVAANQSGRMIAIDGRGGQRVWTRTIGSDSPLWAAGESIFVVSDEAQLMRIGTRDGRTLWVTQLQAYRNEKKRNHAIAYSGPVLVSGRLLVTDAQGDLMAFDAESGSELSRVKIEGGSGTGPVVANGTVYVLTDSGTLYAFR